MRVPVSVTRSAVMPSRAPSLFTRSRNAGGKAYSRPQSRPTFIAVPSHAVGAGRLFDTRARLVHDRADHGRQIARLAKDAKLPVGARALGENRPDVLHLAPAAQLVDDVVDNGEQLDRQIAHRHLAPFAEVDQLAVETPPGGAPLVLLDQAAVIDAEAEILRPQPVELHHDRLRERGDGDGRPR